jgi:hypothetical protein
LLAPTVAKVLQIMADQVCQPRRLACWVRCEAAALALARVDKSARALRCALDHAAVRCLGEWDLGVPGKVRLLPPAVIWI